MSFSPIHVWQSMGLFSKIITVVLLIMFVVSLAVMVERLFALLLGQRRTSRFLPSIVPMLASPDYGAAIGIAKEHRASPFARLLVPVLGKVSSGDDKKLGRVELARREAERQKEAVGEELRRGMGAIATVGSVAPFIGLLGTVAGIITAFTSIAATGSGGLGAVSAGIAEALVETALGLVVAIIAVLGFNFLNNWMNGIETEVARRAGELLDELENTHGSHDSGQYERAA
jgi:biopolymer transport protein ExbB/TolQ